MRGCCIQAFAFASVVQGSVSLVGAADTFSGEYMLLRSRYLGPFQVQSAAATLNHCNMKEFIAHFSIQPCWLQVITISHGLSASTKWNLIVEWHSFCRFFEEERSCLNISLSRDVAISGWTFYPWIAKLSPNIVPFKQDGSLSRPQNDHPLLLRALAP